MMMQFTRLLVFSLLILIQGGEATQFASECPSMSAERLAKLKTLVIKNDVHDKIAGSSQDLYGGKTLFDADPNTCIKHSRTPVNGTIHLQTVETDGLWFGKRTTRNSFLKKVENNVYLEVLPDRVENGEDFVLAKVYVLFAENGVFGYFWCLMFEPTPGAHSAHVPSLAGVTVHPDEVSKPAVQASVQAAVNKLRQNKDVVGDIEKFEGKC